MPASALHELLTLAIREENKTALHAWIEATTGYHIPRHAICHNHCAPFDFVADAIFHKFRQAIAHANRSGGKTQDVAIIEALETYRIADLEAVNVGAIQAQSDRCYGYIKEINGAYPFNTNSDPRKLTATRGNFNNGASLQILPGTPAAVNGPHPQLNVLDELELMAYFVVQQAFSMAQSKGDIPAITIITSTVKFATGLMVRMIEEFKERGLPVYSWCIREVMKPLPLDNPSLMARIREVFDDDFLRGMEQADGYYEWEDVINKKLTLDPETWGVEWLCNQPERSGLVYPQFSLESNIIQEDNPRKTYRKPYEVNKWRPIYVLEDFGFGPNNPNVNLFAQVEGNDLIVFDELYNIGQISRDNIRAAVERLRSYSVDVTERLRPDGGIFYSFPQQQVFWIPDPAGLTEIEERKQAGLPVLEPVLERSFYRLENGIPLVRKKIADRSIQVAAHCANLMEELLSYRNKKNRDGNYTEEPVKEHDHGPDCLRYSCLQLFPVIAQAQFEPQPSGLDTSKPLTANLMNKTF